MLLWSLSLQRGYEEFIQHISQIIPVIRIPWSKYRTAEEMAEVRSACAFLSDFAPSQCCRSPQVIAQEYSQMKNIRHVNFEKKLVKAVSPA